MNINALAASSENFLFVSGFGKNENEALLDAKKQLALNLYSDVEVKEKTFISQSEADTHSTYQQESILTSLPIEIHSLELIDSVCVNGENCEFHFKINKNQWARNISQELDTSFKIVKIKLEHLGHFWSDLQNYLEAVDILQSNLSSLKVLSSLDVNEFNVHQSMYKQLKVQVEKSASLFSISFTSASDSFSRQIQGLLSNSSFADSNGSIVVYIKAKTQLGNNGNNHIAKQMLSFKIFDSKSPSVVVSQKLLSEFGISPISAEAAKQLAQQKIIKKITNKSIYSVLN